MECAELQIVFARPDNFHRLAGLFRKHRRFHCVIGERFTAEAAAEQRHVYSDVFFL